MRPRLYMSVLALALTLGCAESNPVAERAARDATQPWLALMDAGEYEQCWDAASPLFRDTESLDAWLAKAEGYRNPLGDFQSREPNVTRVIPNPWGAPSGLYAAVVYDSTWQNGTIFETVYMQEQEDGRWLVAGYTVMQQR